MLGKLFFVVRNTQNRNQETRTSLMGKCQTTATDSSSKLQSMNSNNIAISSTSTILNTNKLKFANYVNITVERNAHLKLVCATTEDGRDYAKTASKALFILYSWLGICGCKFCV